MYVYEEHDQQLLDERVAQFRDQTRRYLEGKLSETEFLPLRLQNGLYVQRYAPMLRVAVPYGTLNSRQLHMLGHIARHYDKGYGHVSTRQNVQYNWPDLVEVPDILADLASVQMHAIQTSGNCIRNITTDEFAGLRPGEVEDPRPWCEIMRQWSTFNPEFAYLPRKFKIAANAVPDADPAVIGVHDIGVQIVHRDGETGFRILAGGGLGRTPMVGQVIVEYTPWQHLLSWLEAIMRVYNKYGNRDNKFKARIKILVKALGAERYYELAKREFEELRDGPMTLTQEEVERVKQDFRDPGFEQGLPEEPEALQKALGENRQFNRWYHTNVLAHKVPGYAAVTLTLKKTGRPPGDITDEEFEAVADLAERYSLDEARTTHQQNIVLPHVRKDELFEVWQRAKELGFATPNLRLLTDIVACPGGDYCALANAKSIPIAEAIQRRFDDLDFVHDLGDLDINISGCMNACGHHHVGHIGILGVDKKGREYYQITVGGRGDTVSRIGEKIGPSFEADEVPDVISKLIDVYVENRVEGESFINTYERLGIEPFRERAYEQNDS